MRTDTSDWPLLTRFYGISPKELAGMPGALLRIYREAVPQIQAMEMLTAMKVADFPMMEAKDREETHKDLLATVGVEDDSRAISPGSNLDVLALQGIGIAVVKEGND